mmetsp:Transcript_53790/g.101065  ORF Transcript_53790/g.101065 Transcript_53790/m.101065 type:complete len:230 (-) Transcript_53790:37-726(-)
MPYANSISKRRRPFSEASASSADMRASGGSTMTPASVGSTTQTGGASVSVLTILMPCSTVLVTMRMNGCASCILLYAFDMKVFSPSTSRTVSTRAVALCTTTASSQPPLAQSCRTLSVLGVGVWRNRCIGPSAPPVLGWSTTRCRPATSLSIQIMPMFTTPTSMVPGIGNTAVNSTPRAVCETLSIMEIWSKFFAMFSALPTDCSNSRRRRNFCHCCSAASRKAKRFTR